MRYIDFSQNDFSGLVPEELGYMENLRVLKLSDNRLSGEVPVPEKTNRPQHRVASTNRHPINIQ